MKDLRFANSAKRRSFTSFGMTSVVPEDKQQIRYST
jgi:hypothetical protein